MAFYPQNLLNAERGISGTPCMDFSLCVEVVRCLNYAMSSYVAGEQTVALTFHALPHACKATDIMRI